MTESDRVLRKVSKFIPPQRRASIARLLNVSERDIQTIKHNCSDDTKRQTFEFLSKWRDSRGPSASYADLREAAVVARCSEAVGGETDLTSIRS